LTDISCEYAVISVGEGNSHRHPHADILAAMEARNMTVYTTIDYGNVVAVISDAGALTFVTEKVPSAEISA
jgi:Predicted hydrolase (metallo-beta-lactamase superfamily)